MEIELKKISIEEFKKQLRTGICLNRVYENSIQMVVECDCAQPECHTNIIIELEDGNGKDPWDLMTMWFCKDFRYMNWFSDDYKLNWFIKLYRNIGIFKERIKDAVKLIFTGTVHYNDCIILNDDQIKDFYEILGVSMKFLNDRKRTSYEVKKDYN